MHPRQSLETVIPVFPNVVYFIRASKWSLKDALTISNAIKRETELPGKGYPGQQVLQFHFVTFVRGVDIVLHLELRSRVNKDPEPDGRASAIPFSSSTRRSFAPTCGTGAARLSRSPCRRLP